MDSLQNKEVRLGELMPVIRERLESGSNIWIYPNGTSMLPMSRQGIDKVLLSPLPNQLQKYDLPFYQRDNGQFWHYTRPIRHFWYLGIMWLRRHMK